MAKEKEENQLDKFIKESIKLGKKKSEIREILVKSEWNEIVVDYALAKYVDVDYPIAVPRPYYDTTFKTFFLNIVYFLMFYLVIISLIYTIFGMVNYYMLSNFSSFTEAFRVPVSLLVVCCPILLLVGHVIRKDFLGKRMLIPTIRLRFLYATLFISLITIVIASAICFFGFLLGEITIRFVIKYAILIVFCLSVYLYLYLEIKKIEENS